MRLLLLLPTLMLIILTGCASSGPVISTNISPDADFSSVKTFNIMQPSGSDRSSEVPTSLTEMLSQSVSDQMGSRAIYLSDTPDLLVNFYVLGEDREDVRSPPTSSASFHSRHRQGRYSTWGSYRTTAGQYTAGTLVIDLIDPATNTLVWEGVAQQSISSNSSNITQQQINEVVNLILADFRSL